MNLFPMNWRHLCVLLIAMVYAVCPLRIAQASLDAESLPDPAREIKVGVFGVAPFSIPDTAMTWTGYAVVMFEAASIHARVIPEFQEFTTMNALLDAVASGQVDAGVGNILVTSERLEQVDFSQPILDAGLRVMVSSDHQNSISRLLTGLLDGGHIHAMVYGSLALLAFTVLVLVALRRLDREFTPHWHEGFAESLHHVVSVAVTGKTTYKGGIVPPWVGRIIAATWLLFGVATVAYLTSSVTSVMTTNALHGQIHGPADLVGKTVGVLSGTGGETYCSEQKINIVQFPTMEAAAQALTERRVDAIVANGSTLEYYDLKHADVAVMVVGELFQRRHFAFAFHRDSSNLRQKFDIAILALRENETLEQIRRHWFGH